MTDFRQDSSPRKNAQNAKGKVFFAVLFIRFVDFRKDLPVPIPLPIIPLPTPRQARQ
jgi:hypothetical protein